MRIITANLNGIRSAQKKGFFDWMATTNADVVCVQELKAQESDLTDEMRAPAGYTGHFSYAVEKGYKTYFKSMEDLTNILKLKDMTRTAMAEYKRLLKADLIILDDIMLFPVEKSVANALFNFVNQIYERTCFIITTNKSPSEWSKMLDDEVLATALLDRLLYHCDIINLSGKSYRMENRKTFFDHHK
jgi:exonuclease III